MSAADSRRAWRGTATPCAALPAIRTAPAWRTHRTAPVDERDMLEFLARAAWNDAVCGRSLDAAGAEVVSYGELIERIRDQMLLSRPTIGFKRLRLTPIASRISALIAGE